MSRNPVYIKMINSKRWKELRLKKLLNNPVCEICQAEGRSTLATEIHHITPVESVPTARQMEKLMFSYNNLQSVCGACHANVHQQMFSHTREAIQANNHKATERFFEKYLK